MDRNKVLAGVAGVLVALLIGPRLLDRKPPVVVEEVWRTESPTAPDTTRVTMDDAPTFPLRGTPELEIRLAEVFPGESALTLSGIPQTLELDEKGRVLRTTLDFGDLPDGQHILTLTLKDGAWPANRAQVTRGITLDRTPPGITLARSSRSTAQGRTYAVFARANEPVQAPTVTLDGEAVPAVVLDDAVTIRALTGISVKEDAGEHPLVIEARDEAGNLGRFEATTAVAETDFPFGGYIKLSPKKQDDMLNKKKSEESNSKRKAAYGTKVGLAVPDALFTTPVEGILTSPFGKVRKYNTGIERHHLGTDLAAPSGTPVVSAADGQVVLAEMLHIYGNAVIVNHADGISTSFNHLSAIDVKVGDTVKAGQKVGEVGSTGQSTGPHLHWGMVVNGEAVAPEQWTTRRFDQPLEGDFGE